MFQSMLPERESAPVKLSSRIPWPSHRDEDGRRQKNNFRAQAGSHRYTWNVSGADFSLCARPPQPRVFRVLSAFPSVFSLSERGEQVSFMINPTGARATTRHHETMTYVRKKGGGRRNERRQRELKWLLQLLSVFFCFVLLSSFVVSSTSH